MRGFGRASSTRVDWVGASTRFRSGGSGSVDRGMCKLMMWRERYSCGGSYLSCMVDPVRGFEVFFAWVSVGP